MNRTNTILKIFAGFILLSVALACGISFNMGNKEVELSPPELTLEAVYMEQTVVALAGADEEDSAADEGADMEMEAVLPEVVHEMVPGNPGAPDVEKDEIDTSNTADTRTALGDSYRLGNFERPFTENDMLYHPELDIVTLYLAEGTDFYYFTFEMSGGGDNGFAGSRFGVEFDTDFDGRGDFLLWAMGTDSTEWTIEGVHLFEDSDGDVGGSSPVVPDTNNGSGYERVLFSPDELSDPDVAWVRVDPSNASNIQVAVKISYIDKNRWYWKAWADAGIADPAQFDYNDSYSEAQAGSPIKGNSLYPIAAINMVDSTCWIAYKLTPTGTELGGCYVLQPTQPPPPPDPTPKPLCLCPRLCQSIGWNQTCCNYCGCTWGGNEFGCY